jgi:hypothetical protein
MDSWKTKSCCLLGYILSVHKNWEIWNLNVVALPIITVHSQTWCTPISLRLANHKVGNSLGFFVRNRSIQCLVMDRDIRYSYDIKISDLMAIRDNATFSRLSFTWMTLSVMTSSRVTSITMIFTQMTFKRMTSKRMLYTRVPSRKP